MTKKEFAMWQAVTKSSEFRWTEDEIYRLNGHGAFYYHGGENGIYMRIQKDGMLEAGTYEGAIPHIGEAFFKPVVERQCKDFNEAYTKAMEAGGKQFLIDMFSQPDFIVPDEPEEETYENYVYKPLHTVTVGDMDIEIAEDKNAAPDQRFAVYEREDLGMDEQFHRMVHTDDFAEAVKAFTDMTQDNINGFQTTAQQAIAELINKNDAKKGAESPSQGIIFSRVQLCTDTGEESDFYMPGIPRSYDDLEDYIEFVDFTEFISTSEAKDITATVTAFSDGSGAPRDANESDIDWISKAVEEFDVEAISGWRMGEKFEFTFDYDVDELFNMGGIE